MNTLPDAPFDNASTSSTSLSFEAWPEPSPAELLALRHALHARSESLRLRRAAHRPAPWTTSSDAADQPS